MKAKTPKLIQKKKEPELPRADSQQYKTIDQFNRRSHDAHVTPRALHSARNSCQGAKQQSLSLLPNHTAQVSEFRQSAHPYGFQSNQSNRRVQRSAS